MVGGVAIASLAPLVLAPAGAPYNPLATMMSLPVVAVNMAVTFIALSGSALLTCVFARVPIARGLGFQSTRPSLLFIAPLGIIALGPTSDLLVRAMAHIAPDFSLGTLEALSELTRAHPAWVLWPLLALLPGVGEEVFFRGMIQRSIASPAWAIGISAVAFALFHGDPRHVAGVLPLGVYLAWIGHRSRSLWVPVAAHVANNSAALAASALLDHAPDETIEPDLALLGVSWIAVAAVIAVIVYLTREDPRLLRDGETAAFLDGE